jgi:NAD(P)-dependent dehydrogenase (short-subunit alcohol dehydrogenase family)
MQLRGAQVLVTGGAKGIGAATVEALQREGARVVVFDLAPASGADEHVVVDVGDEAAVVDALAAIGGLDGAVLNAGIGGSAPLLDMTTDEWDRVMRVNLRGTFVLLRECGRAMRDTGRGGSIAVVTSISAFLAERRMAHYSASKAGATALVRVAARELGEHGIRVNAVAPGTTDTPLFAATDRLPGYRERVARRAALGRVGHATDVADAIVALLGLDWVTGQVLVADGGVSLASPIDPFES